MESFKLCQQEVEAAEFRFAARSALYNTVVAAVPRNHQRAACATQQGMSGAKIEAADHVDISLEEHQKSIHRVHAANH